jgi:hypothetical protein
MTGDLSGVRTMIQLFVSGVGSLVILTPLAYRFIKGATSKDKENKPTDNTKKEEEEEMDNECCPLGNDETVADFKALHYLKERAIELQSKEALDLVVKLNTILFSISDTIKEEEKQDANKV